MTDTSNTVATTPLYSEETLGNIKSFEDALAVLGDAGIAVTDITEYGDGFAVVDKDALVNVKFVLLDYKFAEGDYMQDGKFQEFAILRVVTEKGDKCIVTDGSTGIRRQVVALRDRGVTGGILCPRGLTVSEYDYTDDKGNTSPAKTYYLGM